MKKCIYCWTSKKDDEFNLEHVIPQFLGGAHAPDQFKIRNVCKKCNSNLGLFVDASFQKNWFVANQLLEIAYDFYDPEKPTDLPLRGLGPVEFNLPYLDTENEVCESWLGPLGEQVFWVRPNDKRLFAYLGGNPRTTKDKETRAYFLFSQDSLKNFELSCLTFEKAFGKRSKVKKIICTPGSSDSLSSIGFSIPDKIDLERIDFFNKHGVETKKGTLPFDINFDKRFLAKISIGIAYSLFGEKTLETSYAKELHDTLWPQPGNPASKMKGVSFFSSETNKVEKEIMGENNAITLIIIPYKEQNSLMMSINIRGALYCCIKCASLENISASELTHQLGEKGMVLVIYPPLSQVVKLDLMDYAAHKAGIVINNDLQKANTLSGKSRDYFNAL